MKPLSRRAPRVRPALPATRRRLMVAVVGTSAILALLPIALRAEGPSDRPIMVEQVSPSSRAL